MTMRKESSVTRQQGAALVVGLLLLLVITVFAVTSMSTTTLDLALAGNAQFNENAFQAAESAIEIEILRGPATVDTPRAGNYVFGQGTGADTDVEWDFTGNPPEGYSFTGFASDHFIITSDGVAGKNARSLHEQGFFVTVPIAD